MILETETLKMVQVKSIDQQAPEYLISMFQRLCEISARQLHNGDTDLHIPFQRTACGQKCFRIDQQNFGAIKMQKRRKPILLSNSRSHRKMTDLEHCQTFPFT